MYNSKVLKNLLRQVRFPLFDEKDFTEAIALNKNVILTARELLEVYAYFHSSPEK